MPFPARSNILSAGIEAVIVPDALAINFNVLEVSLTDTRSLADPLPVKVKYDRSNPAIGSVIVIAACKVSSPVVALLAIAVPALLETTMEGTGLILS